MRVALVLVWLALGCEPPSTRPIYAGDNGVPYAGEPVAGQPRTVDPSSLGTLDDRLVDFVFDGGQLDFEMYRDGDHVVQLARSHYTVPVMIAWSVSGVDNLAPLGPTSGVAFLPPAASPSGAGSAVVLAELHQLDRTQRYRRELQFKARFGDPRARPTPYIYALPYPHGLTFSVLQGFHGSFSHRGSNEFAVDFDCPVATPVLAARPGVVVVANAAAQGSGTTPEFLDYKRTNFVLIRHDDGTLGEYMHLSPSGITVTPGQRVERGQALALSGNTGYSSTPHLHFQVMTAAEDGVSARSFPFQMAVAPRRVEAPMQGQRYAAWE
jgi:murein DD-endopeptidase MepM/ murein hydrolase activator NlpD